MKKNVIKDEFITPDIIAHAEIKECTIKEDHETGDLFIEGFASTKGIDEGNDLVDPEAFRGSFKRFMKNPVILAFHGFGEQGREPIGKAIKAEITNKGFWIKAFISKSEEKIRTKIKEGVLKAFSIGFRILKDEAITRGGKNIRKIIELDLMEVSVVGLGMNREALFSISKAFELGTDLVYKNDFVEDLNTKYDQLSIDIKEIKNVLDDKVIKDNNLQVKSVISFKKYPLAPENLAWSFSAADGNKLLGDDSDNPDFTKFGAVHTFVSEDRTVKSSYKLPHHKEIDGVIKTVRRGVIAAMGALLGARGGVDVPSNERRGIYNHLAKHYKEFNMTPPEFKVDTFESVEKYLEDDNFGNFDVEKIFIFHNEENGIEQFQAELIDKDLNDLVKNCKCDTKDESIKELENEIIELKAGKAISDKTKKTILSVIDGMNKTTTLLKVLVDIVDDSKLGHTEDDKKKPKKKQELKKQINVGDLIKDPKVIRLILENLKALEVNNFMEN